METAITSMSSHHKGAAWESEFVAIAKSKGLVVDNPSSGRHDKEVNGMRVQCKCIDEVRNGRVCIDNMRPVKANDNERGYMVSEYDVLALKSCGEIFIIPVEELHDTQRKGFCRSKISIESIKHFKNAWAVFDGKSHLPSCWLFTDEN